jgi:hypothetical protein
MTVLRTIALPEPSNWLNRSGDMSHCVFRRALRWMECRSWMLASLGLLLCGSLAQGAEPALVCSAQSGPWSARSTWENGKLPTAGVKVQIREGHRVTYDVKSDDVIRSLHIAGTLEFATDRDTRLNAGLIKVQAGDNVEETGFDCEAHQTARDPAMPRAELLIGTPDRPVEASHQALIRLVYIDGMDKQSCPALVCCGGRMELHGAPLNRSWVKLGATAAKGDEKVQLAEPVSGWRVGDRVIITATSGTHDTSGTRRPGGDQQVYTEERKIKAIDATSITLDRPLEHEHLGAGQLRGEVANLSRNVIVESADPQGVRGHTMYHLDSAGSVSYAELRHLGKENVLGRYSMHFHLIGNSMRGASVVGASIWDSHNRWITIHGTNYLVVRDCVGYQSVGHGFFMEDGTEVFNVLDRNLAVQAFSGKRLPNQVLPFDPNDGAGFWWANSLNTFTRNVACENDRYGFRFEATQTSRLNLTLPIMQADGQYRPVDIRTLPFVRFDDNECHCDGKYGVNIGEGVNRVGPDERHPFIVRNLKIWEVHYAFRPQSPCLLVEHLSIDHGDYGIYHPNYDRHVYRNLSISDTNTEPFNRGHDDDSVQYGPLAVDGVTFDGIRSGRMPLVQISDNNPTGAAETHFRNVRVTNWSGDKRQRAWMNLGGGPRRKPKTERGVPIFVHDYFGAGRHAKVVSVKSGEAASDGLNYVAVPELTGDESRAAEVSGIAFPQILNPIDDLPPATVIMQVTKQAGGKLLVRGAASDNGEIRQVLVNNQPAEPRAGNFAEWSIVLEPSAVGKALTAAATDAAGNREQLAHTMTVQPAAR